jgi:carbamoyl-phosphate synthase large subunit
VIPPVDIPEKHRNTIYDYTKMIACELKVIGLMNIQYAIHDDTVYILEANPRASRTVPLVSKVCNIPMAKIATKIMLGQSLDDFRLKDKTFKHFGVKEAVLPFNMFPEVDPVLGPEMRSTGEVLGLADSYGLAFFKSQEATKSPLPLDGTVLITIADRDKLRIVETARMLKNLGFHILATKGTNRFLAEHGIQSSQIKKISEGRPNIIDAIKNGHIQLVINTPKGKSSEVDDSYIRKESIKHGIPYITTTSAARAAARGIEARRNGKAPAMSLQDYHKGIV